MGYTYDWTIRSLKKQNSGSLNDIIIGTQWKVVAIDNEGYSASFDGATPFKAHEVNINSFTDFNSLSESQVIEWVKNVVSGSAHTNYWAHIDEKIKESIDIHKNSIKDVPSEELPWGTGSIEPPYDPAQ